MRVAIWAVGICIGYRDAVQQQALAVSLGQWPFEVDNDRIDTMHLLVGIRIAFPYRHHQHEEFGILLGDLRKNLDEVEGPIAPGVTGWCLSVHRTRSGTHQGSRSWAFL